MEGAAVEIVMVFVDGVDVTAGFRASVEGTTASVVLRVPYETARSSAAEPAKAGDAVVAPKQTGSHCFYKVRVSDAAIEAV